MMVKLCALVIVLLCCCFDATNSDFGDPHVPQDNIELEMEAEARGRRLDRDDYEDKKAKNTSCYYSRTDSGIGTGSADGRREMRGEGRQEWEDSSGYSHTNR